MSAQRSIGGHHKPFEGGSNDWLTPPSLLAAMGWFDLDPCASIRQPWRTARTEYTVDDDGLSKEWKGDVWLNPPYGPHVGKWLRRLAEHGNGVALIFARTETRFFHEHVWPHANAIYFFAGRLHFHRPITGERMKANAGAPSVLIGYGSRSIARLHRVGSRGFAGKLVRL